MFIAILIAWNLPILRDVIAGLKVSECVIVEDPKADHGVAVHRRRT
jgi:hypothetical protein